MTVRASNSLEKEYIENSLFQHPNVELKSTKERLLLTES